MRHCAFYSVLYQRDVGSRRVIAPVEATRFHGFPFLWERVPAGSFLPILRALSALVFFYFLNFSRLAGIPRRHSRIRMDSGARKARVLLGFQFALPPSWVCIHA